MNDTVVSEPKKKDDKKDKKDNKLDKLSNMDKVYDVLKQKNKKLKKEIIEQKNETETLRGVFAEFQVEFKQNKKD
jgi:predicted RNase H-like nuclease (RuvC/YqgF family)